MGLDLDEVRKCDLYFMQITPLLHLVTLYWLSERMTREIFKSLLAVYPQRQDLAYNTTHEELTVRSANIQNLYRKE